MAADDALAAVDALLRSPHTAPALLEQALDEQILPWLRASHKCGSLTYDVMQRFAGDARIGVDAAETLLRATSGVAVARAVFRGLARNPNMDAGLLERLRRAVAADGRILGRIYATLSCHPRTGPATLESIIDPGDRGISRNLWLLESACAHPAVDAALLRQLRMPMRLREIARSELCARRKRAHSSEAWLEPGRPGFGSDRAAACLALAAAADTPPGVIQRAVTEAVRLDSVLGSPDEPYLAAQLLYVTARNPAAPPAATRTAASAYRHQHGQLPAWIVAALASRYRARPAVACGRAGCAEAPRQETAAHT